MLPNMLGPKHTHLSEAGLEPTLLRDQGMTVNFSLRM